MGLRVLLVVVIASAGGCKNTSEPANDKKPSKPVAPAATPSDAAVAKHARAIVDAAPAAKPAAVDASMRVEDLPKLPLPALTADNVHARYALAVAAAKHKKLPRALAILNQLRQLGCSACRAHLDKARTDNELRSLWPDPRFAQLTVSTTGPFANIAMWRIAKVDKEKHPKAPANTLRAFVAFDHLPGYVRPPTLTLQVRDRTKVLRTVAIDTTRLAGTQLHHDITLTNSGNLSVDLLANGRSVGSAAVQIAKYKCAGKQRLELVETTGFALRPPPQVGSWSVYAPFWVSKHTSKGWYEWRLNGKLIKVSDKNSFSSDGPGECDWKFGLEEIYAPEKLWDTRGVYELRVYRNGYPGTSITMDTRKLQPEENIDEIALRTKTIPVSAKAKKWFSENGEPYRAPSSLKQPPIDIGKPGPAPLPHRYKGNALTKPYPSISKDGRFLATREFHAIELEKDQCAPPIGRISLFRSIDGNIAMGSLDVRGFASLNCGQTKLPGGVTVKTTVAGGETKLRFSDKAGKLFKTFAAEIGSPTVCTDGKQRIAVIRERASRGGRCDSLAATVYSAVRY